MGDFKQLTVWQRSRTLVTDVYAFTRSFPASEAMGLTSQLRRAASSIPANIAEGCGRHSGRDQARSYRVAIGSAREVECLFILAGDLKLIGEARSKSLLGEIDEIQRMLSALIRHCLGQPRVGRLKSSGPKTQV